MARVEPYCEQSVLASAHCLLERGYAAVQTLHEVYALQWRLEMRRMIIRASEPRFVVRHDPQKYNCGGPAAFQPR